MKFPRFDRGVNSPKEQIGKISEHEQRLAREAANLFGIEEVGKAVESAFVRYAEDRDLPALQAAVREAIELLFDGLDGTVKAYADLVDKDSK